MTLDVRGTVTLGACMPLAVSAQGQVVAAATLPLAELEARLAGALEAQARITLSPPSLASSLQAALSLVQSLQLQIALGLPGASVDLTAMAAVIAELNVSIAALEATLDFAASLEAQLAAGGLHFYTYSGQAPALGGELTAQLSGGLPGSSATSVVKGIVILAVAPTAVAALNAGFGVSI